MDKQALNQILARDDIYFVVTRHDPEGKQTEQLVSWAGAADAKATYQDKSLDGRHLGTVNLRVYEKHTHKPLVWLATRMTVASAELFQRS